MQRKSMWATAVVVAGLGLGMGTGCGMMGGSKSDAKASKGDANAMFLSEAAHGGHAEIATSQLAMQKATNPQVKEFARMMVQDHQQSNQELMQIAQKKGMDLPKRPDEMHMKESATLKNLSGAEFDRAYMTAQVADHQKMVTKYQEKASSAQDPDVRRFAASQLPNLQRHLEQARQIQQSLGGSGGRGTSGGTSNSSDTGSGTSR